jgi:hypothetical protein
VLLLASAMLPGGFTGIDKLVAGGAKPSDDVEAGFP